MKIFLAGLAQKAFRLKCGSHFRIETHPNLEIGPVDGSYVSSTRVFTSLEFFLHDLLDTMPLIGSPQYMRMLDIVGVSIGTLGVAVATVFEYHHSSNDILAYQRWAFSKVRNASYVVPHVTPYLLRTPPAYTAAAV
jgi:hypothetical protein